MNQPVFQRVRELFLEALAVPEEERDELLQQRCRGDDALFREVASLLANHREEPDFLASSVLGPRFSVADAFVAGEPRCMGPYRLQSLLGAGGSSLVYRATHGETGESVALKVRRHAAVDVGGDAATGGRLGHEAALLRQLRHPAIATFHAAGVQEGDGEPMAWLAMELVAGSSIDQFVRVVDASVRDIVALVAEVAAAVQYAHEHGVTHNDLSPANVLVTNDGRPKIVDFGHAAAPFAAAPGVLGGTRGFVAPERQRPAAGRRILAAAQDVYSLGAILYLLLTGRTADERQRLQPEERDPEPWPLDALRPELRGDLCTVVHHALCADPERRCPSAGALAADLRRWLRGEPVAAPRPKAWSRVRRFARRHSTLVVALSTTFVTLLAGIAATGIALGHARQARADEQQQRLVAEQRLRDVDEARSRAESVGDYLTALLRAAAGQVGGRRPSLETVFVEAAEKLDEELVAPGSLQSGMCHALGLSLHALGRFALAERHLQRAVQLAKLEAPGDSHRHFQLQVDLAVTRVQTGRYADALADLQPVRDALRLATDAPADLLLRCLHHHALATFELAGPRPTRPLLDELLPLASRWPPGDHVALMARTLAARVASAEHDHAAAIAILEPALQDAEVHLGKSHPQTLTLQNNLGLELLQGADRQRAEALLARALAGRRERFGDEHPETLQTMHNLASVHDDQGRTDEAIALLQKVVEARSRTLGADHPRTLVSRNNLARQLEERGDLGEAETMLRSVVEAAMRTLPQGHPQTTVHRRNLARLLVRSNRITEALPLLELCLQEMAQQFGDEPASVQEVRRMVDQVRRRVGPLQGGAPAEADHAR